MSTLRRNRDHRQIGKPKLVLSPAATTVSDTTPMRGNISANAANSWINTGNAAKRSLLGRKPLGTHPAPELSTEPPKASEAKVKYFHNYGNNFAQDSKTSEPEEYDGCTEAVPQIKAKEKTYMPIPAKDPKCLKDMPLSDQVEFLKAKLITLAQEHCALLTTANQRKRFGAVTIRRKPEHLLLKSVKNTHGQVRKNETSIVEEATDDEEMMQVESTEDQLLSYSQLSTHTVVENSEEQLMSYSQLSIESLDSRSFEKKITRKFDRNEGTKTPVSSNIIISKRLELESQQDINSTNLEPVSRAEEEADEATVLGDGDFPNLSQESIHTIQVPINEWNTFNAFMQDAMGIFDNEYDVKNITMNQLMRTNSLMTFQSAAPHDRSQIQDFSNEMSLRQNDDGSSKVIKRASNVGFSQLSQLEDFDEASPTEDAAEKQNQFESQLTQTSITSSVLNFSQEPGREASQTLLIDAVVMGTNETPVSAEYESLSRENSQWTETSLASTLANTYNPELEKQPLEDYISSSKTLILSTNKNNDMECGQDSIRFKCDKANHQIDEQEIFHAQPEESQMTQTSLASSVLNAFTPEKEKQQLEMLKAAQSQIQEMTAPGTADSLVDCNIANVGAENIKSNVRVGVGVLVKDPRHPNKVFAGVRKNSHGAGTIALPGGHLEMYESWEECAIREVKEETDLDIVDVSFGHVTNDPMESEGKHYVTIFMLAKVKGSSCMPCSSARKRKREGPVTRRSTRNKKHEEDLVLDEVDEQEIEENIDPDPFTPKTMEPDKCQGWSSYSWKELVALKSKNRIFGPLQHLLDDKPKGVISFFQKKLK